MDLQVAILCGVGAFALLAASFATGLWLGYWIGSGGMVARRKMAVIMRDEEQEAAVEAYHRGMHDHMTKLAQEENLPRPNYQYRAPPPANGG